MKRIGLIGLVIAALLVISASPVMAAEVNNVTLNSSGLYLLDFNVTPTSGVLPLTINVTSVYLKNTNTTTDLTGTVYLYIDGVNKTAYNCSVTQTNNTTGWVSCGVKYTFSNFPITGEYKVSVGKSGNWLPNTTIMVFVQDAGPVSVPGMYIDRLELSDDEVNVGEAVTIYADWGANDTQTRRIAVIDWATYVEDVKGDIPSLLSNALMIQTLSTDAGSASWDFTPEQPGYYLVIAFNSTDINKVLGFKAVPTVAGKPTVSISVDKSTIALVDYVKVSASMSTDVAVTEIRVFVTGSGYFLNESGAGDASYMLCNVAGINAYTVSDACGKDSWYVKVVGVPEGTYVAKIDVNYAHPEKRAEATAVFQIVKPAITSLDVPSQHVKGTDLKISGTCNLQKSGTKNDNATYSPNAENYAELFIYYLNGTLLTTQRSFIDEGGNFAFKIDNFGPETGYYKVVVKIWSDQAGNLNDTETAVFEVVKPEIKLTADKYTATRGETVTFTIDTNLKVNNQVQFTIDNTAFCSGDPDCVASKTYAVDVLGDVVIKLTVDSMAPLTDYKFKAEIVGLGVSDEVRVTVVKQTLNITAESNTVVRGGDVRFTGSTTADVVYVYANEPGVFRIGGVDVAELPSDTVLTGSQLTTAMVYPDSNDKLDFKVDVLVSHLTYGDVSPGTYYLYFYAPANVTGGVANEIDRASDTQAIVAITVTDPKIESVYIPSKIPYQGAVEVSILTAPGDRSNVELTFTLEGSNIKARPGDFSLSSSFTPDANNWVNFTLDFKQYAANKGSTLEPGLYVFTAKLKFIAALGGDEVDSKEVLVEIVPQTLDVTIEPSQPVVGDQVKVTVSTNREGKSGYDHIWVTMVGTNYKSVQRVTLDSTGKGTVTFETVGLAAGTYKFYVRDTAGTVKGVTEVQLAEDLYDLDPADTLARVYNAHDDLLVIKTIELLETAPTTTTTVATTTTTAVTTTTVATTTTTVEQTTTTAATTTTTPSGGGGIPGFEAVFAIAGLLAVAYLLRRR